MTSLEARFWPKVDRRAETECWPWTAHTSRGYGHLRVGDRMVYAHRISYELNIGPIPAGNVVDHTCHNRACVNPSHLQAVTQKQNCENRTGANHTSKTGIRGVHWNSRRQKWEAKVGHKGRNVYGGLHATLEDAAAAVAELRASLHTNDIYADADPATA